MRQIVSSQTKDNVGSEDRIDPPYLATLVISVILGDLVALVTKRFSVVREIKALAEGLALCFTQDDTTRSRIETESCLFSTAEVDVT
jgi:hypothetical protein